MIDAVEAVALRTTDTLTDTPIHINSGRLTVTFAHFTLENYDLFLRTKLLPESELAYDWEMDSYTLTAPARFAPLLGVPVPDAEYHELPLSAHLFDYQRFTVQRALESKRYACWLDTGLGKSHVILEWCRQVQARTGGRVLILSPLQIIPQTQEIAAAYFGLGVSRLATRESLAAWCLGDAPGLGIATHHMLVAGILPEFHYLTGIAVDEASILKTGGGVIKWNLIKSARGIEYKLTATATPAPNDTMEYASQASFLEKLRTDGEILWTFFTHDKAGNWRVKPHAREAFYRFMASWSLYMRDPAVFGFANILAALPPPEILEYQIPITPIQRELMLAFLVKRNRGMFTDDRMGVQERSKLSQMAKGFLYEAGPAKARRAIRVESAKPAYVANLVRADLAAGHQVLVWTVFDEESCILSDELSDVSPAVLDGSMSETTRQDILERFRNGETAVLISKASLIGYGLNLQHCTSLVFSGFDDSFERTYQAIRRCYRFGQTESVRVHFPYVPELEGMIFMNIRAKEAAFMRDVAVQEVYYRKAVKR